MLGGERAERSKSIEAQSAAEIWRPLRWLILVGFLLSWCAWSLQIGRHWEVCNQVAAIGLLALSPAPCILMFFKAKFYPPAAALITYSLVSLAFGVAVGWLG
jgi:hypothetical protein